MQPAAGGFLSVEKGEVRLVATTFEYADEIDVARAEAAKARAEARIAAATEERDIKLGPRQAQPRPEPAARRGKMIKNGPAAELALQQAFFAPFRPRSALTFPGRLCKIIVNRISDCQKHVHPKSFLNLFESR